MRQTIELVNFSPQNNCGTLSKRCAGVKHQVRAGFDRRFAEGLCAVRPPSLGCVEPFRAGQAGTGSAMGRTARIKLCASAYHSSTARTFSMPRTRNWRRPRLRAWALTHSAVAARWR